MTTPVPPARPSRLVGLSIGQRLLLGLAPALLAVVMVIGLAYYGELGRQAPAYVVAGAAILAALSLWVTWSNTQYLALRIRRLAGGHGGTAEAPEDDELGRIEQVVEKLGTALSESESERREALREGTLRLQEQATMIGASVRDAMERLDEVRIPLHILHDAPFGDLNENQEEMIETARAAADAMDVVLRRLMVCTDVDRDAFAVLLERVSVNDVLRGVLPMLRATGERAGVQLQTDLDPALPKVMADRTRLAEAAALLGADAVRAAQGPDATLTLTTGRREGYLFMAIAPLDLAAEAGASQRMLATRLIMAQGGEVVGAADGVELRLPLLRDVRT